MPISKPDTCMQTVSCHQRKLAKGVGSIHAGKGRFSEKRGICKSLSHKDLFAQSAPICTKRTITPMRASQKIWGVQDLSNQLPQSQQLLQVPRLTPLSCAHNADPLPGQSFGHGFTRQRDYGVIVLFVQINAPHKLKAISDKHLRKCRFPATTLSASL